VIDDEPFWPVPCVKLAEDLFLWQLWKMRPKVSMASLVSIRKVPLSLFEYVYCQRIPKLKCRNAGNLIHVQISILWVDAFDRFRPNFKLTQYDWSCEFVCNFGHAEIDHDSLTFASDLCPMVDRWLFSKHLLHWKGLINSLDLILHRLIFQLRQFSDSIRMFSQPPFLFLSWTKSDEF
jgi:hypothetical protein